MTLALELRLGIAGCGCTSHPDGSAIRELLWRSLTSRGGKAS